MLFQSSSRETVMCHATLPQFKSLNANYLELNIINLCITQKKQLIMNGNAFKLLTRSYCSILVRNVDKHLRFCLTTLWWTWIGWCMALYLQILWISFESFWKLFLLQMSCLYCIFYPCSATLNYLRNTYLMKL